MELVWGGLGSFASHSLRLFADLQQLVCIRRVDGQQEEDIVLLCTIPFTHHIPPQACPQKK